MKNMFASILKSKSFTTVKNEGPLGSHWHKDSAGTHVYDIEHIKEQPKEIDYKKLQENLYKTGEELTQQTEGQWKTLDKDEKSAVYDYTQEDHRPINKLSAEIDKYYRGDQKRLDKDEDLDVADKMNLIDSAVSKMTLPEDKTLFRAADIANFNHPQIKEALKAYDPKMSESDKLKAISGLKGISFTDSAFGSTSISRNVAFAFQNERKLGSFILEITAPKGINGIWLGARSDSPQEHEFLLPRHTKYTITGIKHTDLGIHIQATISK